MRADQDPFDDLRGPVLDAAARLAPPTAADASRRLRRQRAQRAAVASVLVLVVVAGGVGLAGRAGEREVQAAGLPAGGPSGTAPNGTHPGTVPGTVLWTPDGPGPIEPQPVEPVTTEAPGEPAPPAAPPSTGVPPTTATAPATFAGTYQGIGHYRQGSGECPDITQDLDLTMTVDDGSVWTYHSDYCATTDANGRWRGLGTFQVTTPDGVFIGSFESEAQLPTEGTPYGLTVDGGSARFEGARGSCDLTIHLRDLAFGEQENTGTFRCTIET